MTRPMDPLIDPLMDALMDALMDPLITPYGRSTSCGGAEEYQ